MSSEIINYLRKVNAEQALIDRLIQSLHEQQPEIKGDPKTVKKIIAGHVRRKRLTVVIGAYNLNPTYVRGIEVDHFRKKLPAISKSYSLIHTVTGTEVLEGIAGSKFGAGAINDATKHIATDNDPQIDVASGSFGIGCWYKSTSSAANHGIVCKKNIDANINAGFELFIGTDGKIKCRIADGATSAFLDVTATGIKNGSYHSIIINVPSAGNLEAFMDNTSLGTVARSTVGSLTNTRSLYEMARDNAGVIEQKLNGSIAFFVIVKNIFTSAQRTDWEGGLVDMTNEVFLRPYVANWNAEPNMTSGLFQSGT